MRQRLQRLHPVDQLLLLNVRLCPVLLKRLLCCCQLGDAGVDQIGLVVLDVSMHDAEIDVTARECTRQIVSTVESPADAGVFQDVQLDGISDSCHDDLGFSMLTFSPSFEGLSLLLRWALAVISFGLVVLSSDQPAPLQLVDLFELLLARALAPACASAMLHGPVVRR